MSRTTRTPSNLQRGQVRHNWLDEDLVARLAVVRQALIDEGLGALAGESLSEWVNDFQRDAHPETEVAVWEKVVSDYRTHCLQHPALSSEEKKQVFGGLLLGGTQ